MNDRASVLHSKAHREAIWKGNYKSPLADAEADYRASHLLLDTMLRYSKEYAEHDFGVSEISATDQVEAVRKDVVIKGMTFASTLFSAINSLPGLLPWKAYDMLLTLREVVGEVTKLDAKFLNPSHKEVLIACFMLLERKLYGVNANRDYYNAAAEKYLREVTLDKQAPLATRMLVFARASTMMGLSAKQRLQYKSTVLELLYDIKAEPADISKLAQDWKTYVRLARMVFAWKYMFFGLRHDNSRDLRLKSWLFFIANFYKH